MESVPRAFAVSEIPLKRAEASQGPLSSQWTLYDSSILLEKLSGILPPGCSPLQEDLDRILEETGFNKAVRIRMEVLAWKERLRIEKQNLHAVRLEYLKVLKRINTRLHVVEEQLQNTRNILRIQRESPKKE